MTVGIVVEHDNNWDLARAVQIESELKTRGIDSEVLVGEIPDHVRIAVVFGYNYETLDKIVKGYQEDKLIMRYIGHVTDDIKKARQILAGNNLCYCGFTCEFVNEWDVQKLRLIQTGDPILDYCSSSEASRKEIEFGDYLLLAVEDLDAFEPYTLGHIRNHPWKMVDSRKPKEVVQRLQDCRAVITDNHNVADAASLFRKRTLLVEPHGFYHERLIKFGLLSRPISDPKPFIDSLINTPSIVDTPFCIGDGNASIRIVSCIEQEL